LSPREAVISDRRSSKEHQGEEKLLRTELIALSSTICVWKYQKVKREDFWELRKGGEVRGR
jgi:hypothetical protein